MYRCYSGSYFFLIMLGTLNLLYGTGYCESKPDIHSVLDKYIAASNWAKNVSLKVHSVSTGRITHNNETLAFCRTMDFTHRRNTKGDEEWFGTDIWTEEDDSHRLGEKPNDFFRLYSNNAYISATKDISKDHWGGIITRLKASKHGKGSEEDCYLGGFLFGQLPRTILQNKHLGEFLKEFSELNMHEETNNDIFCYRVYADTKYGNIAIWIAPEFGYNAVKMSWIIGPHDTVLRSGAEYGGKLEIHIDSIKYKKKDDTFVPVSAHMHSSSNDRHGKSRADTFALSITSIDLNPNFEALKAFTVILPEGTVIGDFDHAGTAYQVVDSRLELYTKVKPESKPHEIKKLVPSDEADTNDANTMTSNHAADETSGVTEDR